MEAFPKAELQKLRSELKEIDLEQIVEKIYRLSYDKKQQNMAILDATQMNAGNIYGGRASIENKRILRLFPWLEKARSNETMSLKILKQLERIKQLYVV